MAPMSGVVAISLSFILLFGNSVPFIVTVNQSDFPWLKSGAYAEYSSLGITGSPGFVLPNGTFLRSFGTGCPCWANATLLWDVKQRVGDSVFLIVNYSIRGQERTPNSVASIPFNFMTSLDMKIDVPTGMAYSDNKSEGIIGFWSVPLPSVGERITFGTTFIEGQAHNVSAVLGADGVCDNCGLPGTPIVNGVQFTGTLPQYYLPNSVFAAPLTGVFLGMNYTNQVPAGYPQYSPLEPSGGYDYYNGLAITFTIPEYSSARSVCDLDGNTTTNCRIATYSTTLGDYLRSYSGSLYLISTNIDLLPVSGGSQLPLGSETIVSVLVVAAVAALSIIYYQHHRRKALAYRGRGVQ